MENRVERNRTGRGNNLRAIQMRPDNIPHTGNVLPLNTVQKTESDRYETGKSIRDRLYHDFYLLRFCTKTFLKNHTASSN